MPGQFEIYEQKVREYGKSWYLQSQEAQDALARNPIARMQVIRLLMERQQVSTQAVYSAIDTGRWVPDRVTLQDRAIDHALENCGVRLDEPKTNLPVAVFLLGGPGSGKSSVGGRVARCLLERVSGDPAVFDPDELRKLIPEYSEGLGSEVVQEEVATLAYGRTADRALAGKQHILIDTVGNPAYSVQEARHLTNIGWTIMLIQTTVDLEVAIERVRRRSVETGRYVPLEYVRSIGNRPTLAYQAVVDSGIPLIGAVRLDTTNELPEPPIVAATTNSTLFGEVGDPTIAWSEE